MCLCECRHIKLPAGNAGTGVNGASHTKWEFKTTDFITKVQALQCMFIVYVCVDCPYFLNKQSLNWEVLKLNWKLEIFKA